MGNEHTEATDTLPCGHRADYVQNDEVTADEHERCNREHTERTLAALRGYRVLTDEEKALVDRIKLLEEVERG